MESQMGLLETLVDCGIHLSTQEGNSNPSFEQPGITLSPHICNFEGQGSGPRKRSPADIKSFSHELDSEGVRPFPFWKSRDHSNNQKDVVMIKERFEKAKEEVDSDLAIMAADVVGLLENNTAESPEWRETMEDLLIFARRCAMKSPNEFWHQCERIVQKLGNECQKMPPGTPKQFHLRMYFILMRCNRLLNFHSENGTADDGQLHYLLHETNPQPADSGNKSVSRTISTKSLS